MEARISLTEFVDFSASSDVRRLSLVREIYDRRTEGYAPKFDYYKRARDGIVRVAKRGTAPEGLHDVALNLRDRRKIPHYRDVFSGYISWTKKLGVTRWEKPPRSEWSAAGLRVTVNPELGLIIGGNPHAVKLYFKRGVLTTEQIAAVLHMMAATLPARWTPAILDLRRGEVHKSRAQIARMPAALEADAAEFMAIWRTLDFDELAT